jgi:alkanesulfonate monooxygenase SsuD/methylene tetrahydromethanopterin reductase-like flavin-dependent oxidoreductase (luciferase family)
VALTGAPSLEPLTLLSALAASTERIGLIGTATTTYNEPYTVARQFASLDLLSDGRAGWNLVTSDNAAEAANFGRDQHVAHADRYARAREFHQVVTGLWNSWDPDALVDDKSGELPYDPAKLHKLNHRGEHFAVAGPLNVARSPQGRPVVVQAGGSETAAIWRRQRRKWCSPRSRRWPRRRPSTAISSGAWWRRAASRSR